MLWSKWDIKKFWRPENKNSNIKGRDDNSNTKKFFPLITVPKEMNIFELAKLEIKN